MTSLRALTRPAAGLLAALLLVAPGPGHGATLTPLARTLPNGLRVVVFPRPGARVVQLQLQVAAGLRSEAKGQDGLAYLTAQMLRQGTTSRSASDFQTELDTLGATLGVNVNRDAAQIAAGCRASEFESVLEIVSDAVINPAFADEAFQNLRRQIAGQLGTQAQNPALLADESATTLAFGTHPYSHAPRGTMALLLGATRDQVRSFHRDRWRPDVAVLAIAGDIDPQRAFASTTEWFGRWAGKAAVEPARSAPPAPKGVWVSDLPGSPAASPASHDERICPSDSTVNAQPCAARLRAAASAVAESGVVLAERSASRTRAATAAVDSGRATAFTSSRLASRPADSTALEPDGSAPLTSDSRSTAQPAYSGSARPGPRRIARTSVTGLPGRSETHTPFGAGGAPRAGSAAAFPAQRPNHSVADAIARCASMSPAIASTATSGRQRSRWNARTWSRVAPSRSAIVPRGAWL